MTWFVLIAYEFVLIFCLDHVIKILRFLSVLGVFNINSNQILELVSVFMFGPVHLIYFTWTFKRSQSSEIYFRHRYLRRQLKPTKYFIGKPLVYDVQKIAAVIMRVVIFRHQALRG